MLEVSKKMLTESRRNITVASSEKEAGWLLLSSLLNSMPKEVMFYPGLERCVRSLHCLMQFYFIVQEFGDQDFDILILWTDVFTGNPEQLIKQHAELESTLR